MPCVLKKFHPLVRFFFFLNKDLPEVLLMIREVTTTKITKANQRKY